MYTQYTHYKIYSFIILVTQNCSIILYFNFKIETHNFTVPIIFLIYLKNPVNTDLKLYDILQSRFTIFDFLLIFENSLIWLKLGVWARFRILKSKNFNNPDVSEEVRILWGVFCSSDHVKST